MNRIAKALMIQGTCSGAGKTALTAALCRIFSDEGMRVAPFKAQNMSLSATVPAGGGEMAWAQALQARAARTEPRLEMNPVLLKPLSDTGCQVILNGRPAGKVEARNLRKIQGRLWAAIRRAYETLTRDHDLVVIEGAGSPAEINLYNQDLANLRIGRFTRAPTILIGDIHRGGVFASLYGTVALLPAPERGRLRGFIINRFRGDARLLDGGLERLRRLTGKPTLGVIPELPDLRLGAEDSLDLDDQSNGGSRNVSHNGDSTKAIVESSKPVIIVRVGRISNMADFAPLERMGLVRYCSSPKEIGAAPASSRVIVLPGSRATVSDLDGLRRAGWDDYLIRLRRRGGRIVGICGGLQMLGEKISDPNGIESRRKKTPGLGLLPVETVFGKSKIAHRLSVRHPASGAILDGYEIRYGTVKELPRGRRSRIGRTDSYLLASPMFESNGSGLDGSPGFLSRDGRVWGTTLHGVFDNERFRDWFLRWAGIKVNGKMSRDSGLNAEIDRWADHVMRHLDIEAVKKIVGCSG